MLTQLETELLRKAQQLLREKICSFICLAIEEAADIERQREVPIYADENILFARDRLCSYIRAELTPWSSLRTWQIQGQGILKSSDSKIRQDRIDWISWMLGEL